MSDGEMNDGYIDAYICASCGTEYEPGQTINDRCPDDGTSFQTCPSCGDWCRPYYRLPGGELRPFEPYE